MAWSLERLPASCISCVFSFCLPCISTSVWTVHTKTQQHTCRYMLGDRVSYLNIKFHSCTLTIIYSISLSSDFKISDYYYTFLSLSDLITVSIGIADCSSLKYSLTCKCEKGTEQKGAGIRWWLIVRDVMSAPFFSALLSVCFLSQCFSTEPNPDICHSETFPGRYDKDRNECGSCSCLLSLGVAYSL